MAIRKAKERAEKEFIAGGGRAEDPVQKEKKMFSARIDPKTIRRVRIYAAESGKTKEEITQEALEQYLERVNK